MLNTKKIKKRYFIFLIFYVLIGIALLLVLDSTVSPNFTQEYKTILSVIKFVYIILPAGLSLALTNYINKNTKNVEKIK